MQKKPSPLFALVVGAMLFSCSGAESAAAAKLPSRTELPTESKWNLSDIYPSDEAWESEFDRLKNLGVNIAAYQNKLDQSPQLLLECLQARDEIGIASGKLFAYARMHRDENTADSKISGDDQSCRDFARIGRRRYRVHRAEYPGDAGRKTNRVQASRSRAQALQFLL